MEQVEASGRLADGTYFAQGNAFLSRLPVSPVWALPASGKLREEEGPTKHPIEQVNMESGLYFGDRNTEPRAALVAHLVVDPKMSGGKPLDIFVVNAHLTTLMMEREGVPEVDAEASRIRLSQLDVIFRGVISRYNQWRNLGYLQRGEKREPKQGETFERLQPIWVLAGDFNFTPESVEYEHVKKMNFIDVVPLKGSGTKASGVGSVATFTADYIFAGPKFVSLDPLITEDGISSNAVLHQVEISDHKPMVARIPLLIDVLEARGSVRI